MSRRNEVDVVAPHLLQPDHDICKLLIGDHLSFPLLAYPVVLAETALHGTPGEKNSARTVAPYKRWLLPKMRAETCNNCMVASLAESPFSLRPVHPAFPGTEPAVSENTVRFFRSLNEF